MNLEQLEEVYSLAKRYSSYKELSITPYEVSIQFGCPDKQSIQSIGNCDDQHVCDLIKNAAKTQADILAIKLRDMGIEV